ncbi:hypothetical protein NEOLEDRAFT_1127384 [Neolentinus lepideus HHB14362 ss-1]|uniref:Uncharacterized protein n=1 Tax=Neolentinus lepideus HHB14362 ss-1 TaxID=1314782 RepID=A0A165VGL4_9AGAM|nr:hypothetical protein NEOLEDRAFT_1127384 [Neolentinus lepideus HHB14362 ss-1]
MQVSSRDHHLTKTLSRTQKSSIRRLCICGHWLSKSVGASRQLLLLAMRNGVRLASCRQGNYCKRLGEEVNTNSDTDEEDEEGSDAEGLGRHVYSVL